MNILRGHINRINATPYGFLLIELSGDRNMLAAGGGLVLGTLLVVLAPGNILASPRLHKAISLAMNFGRSVPFMILLVAIVPFTRFIVGTSIGTAAAVVPLVVGAIPYVGRLVEAALPFPRYAGR